MNLLRSIPRRCYDGLCRLKWELGQTTAEYALVLLAAAVLAVLLIRWAKDSDALTQFFDAVVSKISEKTSEGDF